MDRRQQKTRKAVFRAFTDLLTRKSYSHISVQDIIDEADIGRSTFYSHFETKDELLRALCQEIFDHVFSADLTREATHDFSAAGESIQDEITHILYHLQDNRNTIRNILSGESREIVMRYFKEYLSPVFAGELEKHPVDLPRDYLLHHMICDFAETVCWWMKNERYSPEEISRFFFHTTLFA